MRRCLPGRLCFTAGVLAPDSSAGSDLLALRAEVRGRVQGIGLRVWVRDQARERSLKGWVRNADDGSVRVHVEGPRGAVEDFPAILRKGPPGARVEGLELSEVPVEGHEQFAIRGVPAGAFAVLELPAERGPRYLLQLEVAGGRRSWSLAREPSMDPAEKRGASELPAAAAAQAGGGKERVWDAGPYEQGGRVPWPAAIERGHAVFVLHGKRLRGGFALQRIRPAQWLLIKRRDEAALAAGAGR